MQANIYMRIRSMFTFITWLLSYILLKPFAFLYTTHYPGDFFKKIAQPVIFVSNHRGHLDVVWIMLSIPFKFFWRFAPVRVMVSKRFEKHNKIGHFLLNSRLVYLIYFLFDCHIIPDQGDSFHKISGLSKSIIKGSSCLVFPEGKINHSSHLSPLKLGAYLLSKQHPDIDIVTISIHYKSSRSLFPSKLEFTGKSNFKEYPESQTEFMEQLALGIAKNNAYEY